METFPNFQSLGRQLRGVGMRTLGDRYLQGSPAWAEHKRAIRASANASPAPIFIDSHCYDERRRANRCYLWVGSRICFRLCGANPPPGARSGGSCWWFRLRRYKTKSRKRDEIRPVHVCSWNTDNKDSRKFLQQVNRALNMNNGWEMGWTALWKLHFVLLGACSVHLLGSVCSCLNGSHLKKSSAPARGCWSFSPTIFKTLMPSIHCFFYL